MNIEIALSGLLLLTLLAIHRFSLWAGDSFATGQAAREAEFLAIEQGRVEQTARAGPPSRSDHESLRLYPNGMNELDPWIPHYMGDDNREQARRQFLAEDVAGAGATRGDAVDSPPHPDDRFDDFGGSLDEFLFADRQADMRGDP